MTRLFIKRDTGLPKWINNYSEDSDECTWYQRFGFNDSPNLTGGMGLHSVTTSRFWEELL